MVFLIYINVIWDKEFLSQHSRTCLSTSRCSCSYPTSYAYFQALFNSCAFIAVHEFLCMFLRTHALCIFWPGADIQCSLLGSDAQVWDTNISYFFTLVWLLCIGGSQCQIVELAKGQHCEVELNFMNRKLKAITVYFGEFAQRRKWAMAGYFATYHFQVTSFGSCHNFTKQYILKIPVFVLPKTSSYVLQLLVNLKVDPSSVLSRGLSITVLTEASHLLMDIVNGLPWAHIVCPGKLCIWWFCN